MDNFPPHFKPAPRSGSVQQDAAGQAAVAPILLRSLRSGDHNFERCRARLPVLWRWPE